MKRVGALETSDICGGFIRWRKQVGDVCSPHKRIADIETQKYIIVLYGSHLGLEHDMILTRQLISGKFECKRGAIIDLATFEDYSVFKD